MEILYTYTKTMDVSGLVIAAIVLTIFFGGFAWILFSDKAFVLGTICATISALSAVFVVDVGDAFISGSLDETYHEVVITDMSKFDTSKYKIVEQRGKIFVVQEISR
ncbi:hypothetical protein G3578_09905 [Brevibacillus sp. SYP-B805]|uniref:hypothetical protein n=1 Tax=Brevibacillus sp. SYP-B805 TaxID=1578199 RepID=UPI0013ECAB36|nr:hypothetical protein [Brevibacillus sp. SYP-B805]NGQ95467.1 hypothetical protein [Brevibacillus sp. SYP-B805]